MEVVHLHLGQACRVNGQIATLPRLTPNRHKLTQARYRERYSGLEFLFDRTRSVREGAAVMGVSDERVLSLLHRIGYHYQPGRWIKR